MYQWLVFHCLNFPGKVKSMSGITCSWQNILLETL